MDSDNISFCTGNINLHIDDICTVIKATIGWNYPTVIKKMHSQFPQGIQVALNNGKVIGVCIITPLDENEAYISVLGVYRDYRRKGIATKLFRRCESMVGKRNISLYSDQDAIPFYKSVGFKLGENPSDVYFATFKPKLDILEEEDEKLNDKVCLIPMQDVSFTDVLQYDRTISMVDREYWVRDCYNNYPESLVGIDDKNKICGYGVFYNWEGGNRYVLQPVLAENVHIAKKIITQFLKKVPEEGQISVKIAKENVQGIKLMEKIGLDINDINCETGPVMFTKYQISVPIHKVFSFMNGMNQPA